MEILYKLYKNEIINDDSIKNERITFKSYTSQNYQLEEIIFYIKNRNYSYDEYVKRCKSGGICNININDVESILFELDNYVSPSKIFSSVVLTSSKSYSHILSYKDQQGSGKEPKFYIIVPHSVTSPISIVNIKNLLLNQRYKPVSIESNLEADEFIEFQFNDVKIHVTSDPSWFSKEEWINVVGIFLDGEKWQFKRWNGVNPVCLFKSIPAFYVHLENIESAFLKDYNIKNISINEETNQIISKINIRKLITERIKEIYY